MYENVRFSAPPTPQAGAVSSGEQLSRPPTQVHRRLQLPLSSTFDILLRSASTTTHVHESPQLNYSPTYNGFSLFPRHGCFTRPFDHARTL